MSLNKKIFYQNNTFRFFVLLVFFVACWFLGRIFEVDIYEYQDFLSNYSLVLSGTIFVCLYVAITTFVWFGPKDVFRILGAILFGPLVSTIFVFIAEMFNAFILFSLSRRLGRKFIEQKFKLKSKQLDNTSQASGFLGILALRINPIIPFRIQDLGAGLSSASFNKYLIAIAIASPIRIFWLQYILAGVGQNIFKDLSSVVNFLMDNPVIIVYSQIYFLIIIILSVIALVVRKSGAKKVVPSTVDTI